MTKIKNGLFGKISVVCLIAAAIVVCSVLLCNRNVKPASAETEDNVTYFGTVVPCGKDNGYKPNTKSSWNPWTLLTLPGTIMGLIPDDDPHKGWALGSFYVKGFSDSTTSSRNAYCENMPVYLKNSGEVTFGFKLDQDINKLNGNKNLVIADDKAVVQDCWIDDPYYKADFHHGMLMIVRTDHKGKQSIVTYTDFLAGLSVGETQISILEEGDYRVILCYEIYKKTGWNWVTDWMDPNGSWFDYRLESYFSVRSGDCMVYPTELDTDAELYNKNTTEKGFKCVAQSKYLSMTVKKEVLNSDGTDIVEDTRFNVAVSDGAVFAEEGKYTITAANPYTNAVTQKIIYVGTNKVMKCNAVTGKSIKEINELVASGYAIASDGTLSVSDSAEQTATGEEGATGEESARLDAAAYENGDSTWKAIAIASVCVVAAGITAFAIYLVIRKKRA